MSASVTAPAPHLPGRIALQDLPRVLAVIVAVLLVLYVALQYDRFQTHFFPWEIHALFDLDEEQSVPNWVSSAMLLVASALTLVVGKTTAGRDRWRWVSLAAVFLVFSMDEVAGIHETVNSLSMVEWTVPGAVFVGLLGLFYLPFFRRLPRRTAVRLLIALAVYFGGAVGVEAIASHFFNESNKRTLLYVLPTFFEEGMEMFGVVLVIRTMLLHLRERDRGEPITIELAV